MQSENTCGEEVQPSFSDTEDQQNQFQQQSWQSASCFSSTPAGITLIGFFQEAAR